MTPDPHQQGDIIFNEIANKISKTIGILSILKSYFPRHVLLMIYNSLVLSYLNYGITIWGFNNCIRLKTLQKRALRHVNNSSFLAHTHPICKTTKTLLLDDLFHFACLKFYYKFTNNLLPTSFYTRKFIETYVPHRNLRRIGRHPPEHSV